MMQVKKYRAATTREALEQVKQDLGEDAFVLETKKVRAGGFLGLGAQMQIEISAATPNHASESQNSKSNRKSKLKLNLTDDTFAAPKSSIEETIETESALPFILTNDISKSLAKSAKAYGNILSLEQPKIETVEISENAPQIVHAKREPAKVSLPEQQASPVAESQASSSSRELELLRAELREVKFSLGAFTNRQNIQQSQPAVDLNACGEVYDSPFFEAYTALAQTGVSAELARKFINDIIPHYKSGFIKAHELTQEALIYGLTSLIKFEENPLELQQPAIMAVIGATGVGKTTTIAKIAARIALHERRPVELVTLDTYRIAAVEQLKTYAEIIGAGCHVVRSVFELDAMLRRLPSDATILIDTTGRNPHDLADQHELSDYLRRRAEIRKCLTVQATTNPADSLAAIKKFEMYGVDCLAFTKMDETTRPGALLELAAAGDLPLTYFCAGQRVPEDLQTATPETFVGNILRENA